MKNFKHILGMVVAISIVLFSCNKPDPGPVKPIPPEEIPPVIPTPTITVNAPTGTLWYGSSPKLTFSTTNATLVKLNDVPLSGTSGTVEISSLQKDSTLFFEALSDKTTRRDYISIDLKVYSKKRTDLCKTGKWKMVDSKDLINGVWITFSNSCEPIEFYPTGDSCRVYSSECGLPGNTRGLWYFVNNESQMHLMHPVGTPPYTVEKLTADSLILKEINGSGNLTREVYVH